MDSLSYYSRVDDHPQRDHVRMNTNNKQHKPNFYHRFFATLKPKGFRVGNCSSGARTPRTRRFRMKRLRLRARILYFIKLFRKWNWMKKYSSSCGQVLTRICSKSRRSTSSSSTDHDQFEDDYTHYRSSTSTSTNYEHIRSSRRSNSFYAEAINDCLEFIKLQTSTTIH